MEILKKNATNVTIIERNGRKTILKSAEVGYASIKDAIRQAMGRHAEIRWYYFPNRSFEIIKTAVPPDYEQPWHCHKKIHEATFVLKGHVLVLCSEDGKTQKAELGPGDLVVLDRDPKIYHTIKNVTENYAIILTLKYTGPDEKNESLFRQDWYPRFAQDLERLPSEHKTFFK